MMSKHKTWSAKHYNAIAFEIRELFPKFDPEPFMPQDLALAERSLLMAKRSVLATLALSLATRFKQDSDEADEGFVFDPVRFLDACSPDTDLYPLSELWEIDDHV